MRNIILILVICSFYACQQSEPVTQTEITKVKLNSQAPKIQEVEKALVIPKGQLSKDIVPQSMKLDLTIVPDEVYFHGSTQILATVNTSQKNFFIHGNLLEVEKVELKIDSGKVIEGSYKQIDDSGIAQLSFPEKISTGNIELKIDYKAPFNEALEGLYRVNDDGINYAFTQFESISARLAFPGFDEPAFKIPFDISLTVKQAHVAITNTPVKNVIELDNGMKKIEFMTTKPLPSYLIAFAVGEFDVVKWDDLPITDVRDRPVPLSGLATKGKGEKLAYALKHTQEIVESLENYFQIPYPYLKLDIIAVPDFSAGAMENAGAITYREQLLLLDDNSSQNQKRKYSMVHAHELAHQWFGNLVTPYWWNDIWLNEAFATWMSYTALQPIYPEQNFDQSILAGSLRAMKSDSLISARKIRQEIKSNHDISSAFDGITYSKGGGVLEMMNTFLSPQQFRKGIQDYMAKYAFKNATADDFIAAISAASNNIPSSTIKASFNSFLEQAGIPFLHIENSCEDGINHISLTQSRYLPLGSQGSDDQVWKIPACFTYDIKGNKHQECQMLDNKQQKFSLAGTGCAEYIMPNVSGSGYYRYALSADSWQQLYNNLNKLSTNEVISLNDSFSAAVEIGEVDFKTLMKVAPIVVQSDSNNIASSPMTVITYMKDKVATSDEDKRKLSDIANQLYQNKFQRLGFEAKAHDSVEDKKLRTSVIAFMADTGNNMPLRSQLVKMAKTYTGYEGDKKIHTDLVNTNIINTALKTAVEDLDHDFTLHLVTLLDNSTDGTERGLLLGGIADSKNVQFNAETRDWILSDRLRGNEIYTILFSQVNDKDKQMDMWKWVQDNIEAFKLRMPTWFQGRLPLVGSGFCNLQQKKELNEFFIPRVENLSGGPRSLAQVTEGIDLCIAKLKHDKPMLRVYLDSIDNSE